MPITIPVVYYSFDELAESVQEKVIANMSDINVDYDWWESVYEDAANIGIKITESDCYRNTIKGDLTLSITESTRAVLDNHGENTDTYKLAVRYTQLVNDAFKVWMAEQDTEGCEHWKEEAWMSEFVYSDEAEDLTNDYRKEMLEEYLSIYSLEYDYQTSEQQIINTILANDYLFRENGSLN